MLRQAQHDIQNVLLLYVVILNEVKNLSGSTTFDPPTNWEILRSAQDDIALLQSEWTARRPFDKQTNRRADKQTNDQTDERQAGENGSGGYRTENRVAMGQRKFC